MKIVRLYYKRNDAQDSNHFYIRKVPDSRTIGIAICHTEEQYDYLVSHRYDVYKLAHDNKSLQYAAYKDGKLSMITQTMASCISNPVVSDYLDGIYSYLVNVGMNPVITGASIERGTSCMEDVVRAYSRWYVSPANIGGALANTPRRTIDDYSTIFYHLCNASEFYGGDHIEGEYISLLMHDNAHHCEDCEYIEYDDDSDSLLYIDSGDYSVCEDCYSDNYTSCYSCGNAHHYDNMYYCEHDENYYCENCDRPYADSIHSYNYTPAPLHFYDYKGNKLVRVDNPTDVNLPFYGGELEVECMGGNKGELADSITNYGGSYEKFAYCKNDGSLSDGFEICFMPMTFHAIKNFNFQDAVLKYRGSSRLQSYNTSTCGIHIHINREAFSDHHLFKFISFVHEFKSLMYLISQRKKTGELNNYARFNNGWKDRAKKEMVDTIKAKKRTMYSNRTINPNNPDKKKDPVKLHSTAFYGEKYVPINLQHKNTVEVRIFKGNLLEGSFRKNYEFVDALYYFTRENPIYKLKAKEFVNHCTNEKKRYPNLNQFLADHSNRLQDILRFPLAVPEGLNY